MALLRDISVRTKLSIGFGLTLALIIAVGLFGVGQLAAFNRVTTEVTGVWLPQVQVIGEMKRIMSEHRLHATLRTRTTDFRQLADIDNGMTEADAAMLESRRAYRQGLGSLDEQILFDHFVNLWGAYQDSLPHIYQRLETGEIQRALDEFETVSLPTLAAARERLNELQVLTNQRSAEAALEASNAYRSAMYLTSGAIVFATFCVVVCLAWLSQNISKPILAISDAMHGLALGDRSAALVFDSERRDEVGKLFAAFAGYRASLDLSDELTRQAALEREHLDAAARNLPVGLCMFDADRRLVLSNQRYAEIYGLPPLLTAPGTPWKDIVRHWIAAGLFGGQDSDTYLEHLTTTVERGERLVDLVELQDGRTINLIHQPLADGGWLATHHDITDLRQSEARISHMARHDSLTDLPNRTLFRERAEDALAGIDHGGAVAFLCLDLDHFKTVNDTLGHPVGDALLKEVATRLRQAVRDTDTVARLGGDEFVIIQSGVAQPVEATALAQRVIEALGAAYLVEGHSIVIGTSIGIAIAPADSDDADKLLKNGDMALYRAKAEGRGTYRFFEPEMDARMQARRFLELDLREALPKQEFELYYQPLLNLASGEISCFEALIRWHHPTRGLVAPGDFIPLAEEIGVIVPIGDWVIKQACLEAAGWPGNVKVAVNLSAVQFRSPRLLSTVVAALSESGLPAQRLELEITESVLLTDTEATLAMLHQIHTLGVQIAMDDFGTGYSSLSYLRSFPFDKIKIDQSFVSDTCDTDSSVAIIRAVTGLSTSLGMVTTAEGVETEAQLDRVRREGCTEAQGFLLSRPVPAGDIVALISSFTASSGSARRAALAETPQRGRVAAGRSAARSES